MLGWDFAVVDHTECIVLTEDTMLVPSVTLHIAFKTLMIAPVSLCIYVICPRSPSVAVCVPPDRL